MQVLNAKTVPLPGRSIIEASAGTGKTYTIASLYLRYVVEQPLGRSLTPENILVVTFTRAATAELRERIRARLHSAVNCFKGKPSEGDEIIDDLLERYADEREQVLKRLYAAEKSMDEAAIFTIHGFCHRALSDQQVTASPSAQSQLLEDDSLLAKQCLADFWRQAIYPLRGDDYQAVVSALGCKEPNALFPTLYPLLSRKSLNLSPKPLAVDPASAVLQRLAGSKQAWQDFVAAIKENLEQVAVEIASLPRLNRKTIDKHCAAIIDDSEAAQPSKASRVAFDYIFDKVATADDKGLDVDLSHCRALLQQWQAAASELDIAAALKSQALDYLTKQLAHEKARLSLQSPDDLMTRLAELLAQPESGERIAKQLRQQYPVALIDEFQDTDPLQFAIFEQLFNHDDCSWMMIGDPKQSIYAFRGADIHTYVEAKQDTQQAAHYTLDKNYRSAASMVAATNALFSACKDSAFIDAQIPFSAVKSYDQGDKGALELDGQAQPSLQIWQFDEDTMVGDSAARCCAQQITDMLNLAVKGSATLGERRLNPGDIAVLVRSRFEAEKISAQLRLRGVRSVFQSRDSVFSTATAEAVYRVLLAMYEPRNERLVMAALALPLCAKSAKQLSALREDELSWQQHLGHFSDLQQLWQQQGVMAALLSWMEIYQIPAQLLADPLQGERQMADLLHCCELLQHYASALQGEQALLNLYQQLLSGADTQQYGGQQRYLESDRDLVQIVTIHASKGLEYPVVMLPYALASRQPKLAVFPQQGETTVDFSGQQQNLEIADTERLAEDLRLLYVAITRAGFACYLGVAALSKPKGITALDYLLNCPGGDVAERDDALAQLVAQNSGLVALAKPSDAFSQYQANDDGEQSTSPAKRFDGTIDKGWRLTSYSAMARKLHSPELEPGAGDEVLDEQSAIEVELDSPLPLAPEPTQFSFAKGADAGNALHDILEAIFQGKAGNFQHLDLQAVESLAEDAMQRAGLNVEAPWPAVVANWLSTVMTTPLMLGEENHVSLVSLELRQVLPEMEFMLSVDASVSAEQFNRLLKEYPLFAQNVAGLDFSRFHGLMRGFIDLSFEANGRYYVCDYKSNYLGDCTEDYSEQAMSNAMADHRYDAQLLFYCLAMHRFLKQQLADYDYQRDFGGALYLFLRGIDGTEGGYGQLFIKPPLALIEALDRLLGGSTHA